MSEQLEMRIEIVPPPLPPLLTLREFVQQMEQEHGPSLRLDAIRAAMEDRETP